MCCFGWRGLARGGCLGLRRIVVAAVEERTRDYGIHGMRRERCIAFRTRGQRAQSPSLCSCSLRTGSCPEPLQQQEEFGQEQSPDLSGRQLPAGEEGTAMLLLEAPMLSPSRTYTFFQGIRRRVVCRSGEVFPGLFYNPCFKPESQTLACSTASALLAISMDTEILSAGVSLSITSRSLHTQPVC